MTINGEIKTILTVEDIALLACAIGNYVDSIKGHTDMVEQIKKANNLIDRLGSEMAAYPKCDFTKKQKQQIKKNIILLQKGKIDKPIKIFSDWNQAAIYVDKTENIKSNPDNYYILKINWVKVLFYRMWHNNL